MDFIEVEGKTYEEAVSKASAELRVEAKDLEIDVTEVDTKGVLGILGSKKVKITARIKDKTDSYDTIGEFGTNFLTQIAHFIDLDFHIKVTQHEERIIYLIQCDHGDVLIGKEGETLEALQYILKLAIAKRYKQSLKLTIDINGYREKRKQDLTAMVKQLADEAKKTGNSFKTDPLNPYERRIIHTLFKYSKTITTKSEGEGHTKQVIISPVKNKNARR